MATAMPAQLERFSISRARRVKNSLLWWVCGLALVFVAIPVVWILVGIIQQAVQVWSWGIFVHTTETQKGLLNALAGTGLITVGVGILTALVGIGTGVYLAEFARPGAVTSILRGASEVLSGVPSIVFGYVGYVALVVYLHWGYSLLAAILVLSFLVVPYVAKSTELALGQVPLAYREGAEGLGMTKAHTLRRILLRAALPGIATGIIVAVAISIGETAPLIYTANWSDHMPTFQFFHASEGYLTYAAYTFYDSPLQSLKNLSADASLLLVVLVIALILSARLLVRLTQKFDPNRAHDAGRSARRAARSAGMASSAQ